MRGLSIDDPRRDKAAWRKHLPRSGWPTGDMTHEEIAIFIANKYRGDLLIWDYHPGENYLSIMLVDRRKFRWNLFVSEEKNDDSKKEYEDTKASG